jgi:hypothetical protein
MARLFSTPEKLTPVQVDYAPGGASKPHHHSGVVLAYIVYGEIRSQVDDALPRVYHAGKTFPDYASSSAMVTIPSACKSAIQVRHACSLRASTTRASDLERSCGRSDGPLNTLLPHGLFDVRNWLRMVRNQESFFEDLGAHYLISENASLSEPARLLAYRWRIRSIFTNEDR